MSKSSSTEYHENLYINHSYLQIMKSSEVLHIFLAIVTLSIIINFSSIFQLDFSKIGLGISFSLIIILTNVFGKKFMASKLDSAVKHNIWYWSRHGFKPSAQLKRKIPAGIILPLAIVTISQGVFKLMTILSYETYALKRRAARRFGPYSFTEMTEWHIALIGAAGIVTTLLVSLISYFIPGLEGLPKLAAFYALSNLIPFSKIDGCHIFFGSRVLWTTLLIITLIFVSYSLVPI
jgi:hypothetical protein